MSELMFAFDEMVNMTKKVIFLAGKDTFWLVLTVVIITLFIERKLLSTVFKSASYMKVNFKYDNVAFDDCMGEKQYDYLVDERLNALSEAISKLYPGTNYRIFIKLIQDSGIDDYEKKKVLTWRAVPNNNEPLTTCPMELENNLIFSDLYHQKYSYFFVTDFEEYVKLHKFHNLDEKVHWNNTTIVYPLEVSRKIVGFLCIVSTSRFGNTRKNKYLKDLIGIISMQISELIPQKAENES